MKCTSPMYLKKQGFFVPCGSCLACRIAHSKEWSVRLYHENSCWDLSCFLTLTYNEENCPQWLSKSDLQKFFKRLRKNSGRKIKYFACGEYGETYARPHYHAIVFGCDYNDDKLFSECWTFGFHKVGSVTPQSIAYVTNYVLKKWTKQKSLNKEVKDAYQSPFNLCSRGIGLDFALRNYEQLRDQLGCMYKGHMANLPRYYVKKLNLDTEIIREVGRNPRLDKISAFMRKYNLKNECKRVTLEEYDVCERLMHDHSDYAKFYEAELKQIQENLEGVYRLKKGRLHA